jgi:LPS sulfotransferase NodH
MHTPFVVLFQGRSGSTWLIEALQSHSSVIAQGEALIALQERGAEAQNDWTLDYLSRERAPECGAVGFKTKLSDILDRKRFGDVLRATGCRIVWLDRENVVKQVISWMRADALFRRTSRWNLYDHAQRMPAAPINPDEFVSRLRLVERGRAELKAYVDQLDLPTHCVTYERLMLESENELRTILQFVGLPAHALNALCLKSTHDDLRLSVTNLAELRSRLGREDYLAMCDEVLAPSHA